MEYYYARCTEYSLPKFNYNNAFGTYNNMLHCINRWFQKYNNHYTFFEDNNSGAVIYKDTMFGVEKKYYYTDDTHSIHIRIFIPFMLSDKQHGEVHNTSYYDIGMKVFTNVTATIPEQYHSGVILADRFIDYCNDKGIVLNPIVTRSTDKNIQEEVLKVMQLYLDTTSNFVMQH